MADEADDKIVIHYPWIWNLTVWLLGGFLLDLPNSDEVYDKIFKAWESQRAAR